MSTQSSTPKTPAETDGVTPAGGVRAKAPHTPGSGGNSVSPPDPTATDGASARKDSQGSEPRPKRPYDVSFKVLIARRANAKKSTGPTSLEGKEASSRNALVHGMTSFKPSILVPGEDADAYKALYQSISGAYIPLNPIGEAALRQLTDALWRQFHRIDLAEAAVITQQLQRVVADSASCIEGITGKKGHPYLPYSTFGVSTLREAVAAIIESLPPVAEAWDESEWSALRKTIAPLIDNIPELGAFADVEATDEALAALRDALLLTRRLLGAQEVSRRNADEILRPHDAHANLIPDGPNLERIIRYAAMNDRKIIIAHRLIKEHCLEADNRAASEAALRGFWAEDARASARPRRRKKASSRGAAHARHARVQSGKRQRPSRAA